MTQDNLTKEVLKEMKKISEKDNKKLDKEQKEWSNEPTIKERKKRKKEK